jgi:3-hydroxy-9,10-secoandrosta-1,3,5(10)-triene-9,17-dione monooxygenase
MAESDPTSSRDPVQLAAALRPLLARNAVQAERDRRLPAENVEALQAANLFKVMTPRRWGGYGAPLPTVLSTFAEIAKGCSASGWVAMILGGVNWRASQLPDRGQEEIFARSSDTRVCAAGSPTAIVRRVDGGLRISGKFPFASGCWHASWAGITVSVADETGNVDTVTAFAPLAELAIEDTWFVAGMCGTGSNTLVANELFVPLHRILPLTRILNGDRPARRYAGEPSDSYAFSAANSLIGIGPVLGIAQAMMEKVIKGTCTRGITFTTYTRQADAPVVQHQIAEAALKIDSAWLQATSAATEVEELAGAGKEMNYLGRARARGVVGYATKLVREVIDTLASIGGASGFTDASPLQRMWRDANIAARHASLTTDPGLEIYGRALLGVEGNITPFI